MFSSERPQTSSGTSRNGVLSLLEPAFRREGRIIGKAQGDHGLGRGGEEREGAAECLGVVVPLTPGELAVQLWLGVHRTWVLWLSWGSGFSCVGTWEPFFRARRSRAAQSWVVVSFCMMIANPQSIWHAGYFCTAWWGQWHNECPQCSPLEWSRAVKAGPLLERNSKDLHAVLLFFHHVSSLKQNCSRAAHLLKASFTTCANLCGSFLWSRRPRSHPQIAISKRPVSLRGATDLFTDSGIGLTRFQPQGQWKMHGPPSHLFPGEDLQENHKVSGSQVFTLSWISFFSFSLTLHRSNLTSKNTPMEKVAYLHPKV